MWQEHRHSLRLIWPFGAHVMDSSEETLLTEVFNITVFQIYIIRIRIIAPLAPGPETRDKEWWRRKEKMVQLGSPVPSLPGEEQRSQWAS